MNKLGLIVLLLFCLQWQPSLEWNLKNGELMKNGGIGDIGRIENRPERTTDNIGVLSTFLFARRNAAGIKLVINFPSPTYFEISKCGKTIIESEGTIVRQTIVFEGEWLDYLIDQFEKSCADLDPMTNYVAVEYSPKWPGYMYYKFGKVQSSTPSKSPKTETGKLEINFESIKSTGTGIFAAFLSDAISHARLSPESYYLNVEVQTTGYVEIKFVKCGFLMTTMNFNESASFKIDTLLLDDIFRLSILKCNSSLNSFDVHVSIPSETDGYFSMELQSFNKSTDFIFWAVVIFLVLVLAAVSTAVSFFRGIWKKNKDLELQKQALTSPQNVLYNAKKNDVRFENIPEKN